MPEHPDLDFDARREHLAHKLSETREYLGLSQQEVSVATGLQRSVISAIETARRRIESVELEALARAYKLPVSYFLDAAGTEQPKEVAHLARTASELAPRDQEELLRFAQFLKAYRPPAS